MFERHEVEALVVGVRLVEASCGPGLAASARSALARIRGAVPPALIAGVDDARVYALRFGPRADAPLFEIAHRAITERRKLAMAYTNDDGTATERTVRPLGLYFWGKAWTLAAWCELRTGFRSFRVDRIREPVLAAQFEDEPDKSLEAFIAQIRRREREREAASAPASRQAAP